MKALPCDIIVPGPKTARAARLERTLLKHLTYLWDNRLTTTLRWAIYQKAWRRVRQYRTTINDWQ